MVLRRKVDGIKMSEDNYLDISGLTRETTLKSLNRIIDGVLENLSNSACGGQHLNVRYWNRVKVYLEKNLN